MREYRLLQEAPGGEEDINTLCKELDEASTEELNDWFMRVSEDENSEGVNLISAYHSYKRGTLCKQRFLAFAGMSVSAATPPVLASHISATVFLALNPLDSVKIGFYSGLICIAPLSFVIMSLAKIADTKASGDANALGAACLFFSTIASLIMSAIVRPYCWEVSDPSLPDSYDDEYDRDYFIRDDLQAYPLSCFIYFILEVIVLKLL